MAGNRYKWGSVFAAALLLMELAVLGAGFRGSSEFKGDGICQFALHGYTLTPQSEAVINQTVQRLVDMHQATFRFRRNPGFRLRMRVYGRYQDFTNTPVLHGLTNVLGVYVSTSKEIVTYQSQLPGSLGTTLLHEASHAIMDDQYRHLQPWLMEGAAEYFAYTLARNAQNTSFLQKRWARLNVWLREGQLPALESLLNTSHAEWKKIDGELAYAASWSLFQFLMGSEANQRMMTRMLLEWQGAAKVDCAGQAERLYPGGLRAMERDWHRWIDKTGSADIYKTGFKGTGVCQFAARGYELTPATEAAINAQVANLLARHRAIFGLEHKGNMRIRIFGDFEEYARFTTNALVSGWAVKAEDLLRVPGYYSPFSKEIVAQSPKSPEHLARTVVFLANHALLSEVLPKAPRWLSSGSSAYFAQAARGGNETEAWQAALQQAGGMPDLKALLTDSSPEWNNERRAEVASWGLFQFLCASESNQRILKSLIKNLQASSETGVTSIAQLNQLYPGGVSRLESDFKKWIGQ